MQSILFDVESNIESITFLDEEMEMCDITVEDDHCYYANGMLTHNSAQELRVPANVSGEPAWKEAFLSGGDVHRSCYSLDTEFLTDKGWKRYEEINKDTNIAQYSETGIEFVLAGEPYFNETDTFISLETRATDLLVTPNHRMYLRTNRKNPWLVKEAERAYGTAGSIRNSGVYEGKEITRDFVFKEVHGLGRNLGKVYDKSWTFTSDSMFKFLGFYLGDGHAKKHKGGRYRINLVQKTGKSKQEEWILALNKEMGGFFRENRSGEGFVILEKSNKSVCEWIVSNCIKDGIKRVPEFIFGASKRQRELFLDGLIRADGSRDKREGREDFLFYADRLELIEDVQRLCIGLGYKTVIDYKHKEFKYKPHHSGTYRIYISPKGISSYKPTDWKIVPGGRSVCYSVPSGLLVVRRNGKVSVCGNTAEKIFGAENYNKDLRKKAKIANFLILYGGNKYSLADKMGVPLEEAEEFYNKYKQSLSTLFTWSDYICKIGRKQGTIKTFFGRPRRVRHYLTSNDYRERSFGMRTCVNTFVQGTSADITKLGILRCWTSVVNNPEYKGDVWMLSTIHDEVNFAVRETKLLEIVNKLHEAMAMKIPSWDIPMEVGIEVGRNWGETFPFALKDGKLIPKMEEKKEDKVDEFEEEYSDFSMEDLMGEDTMND